MSLEPAGPETVVDSTDGLCANVIRGLAMDGVQTVELGRQGVPPGLAPVAHGPWTRFLHQDPAAPARCDLEDQGPVF